jgi:hypothetical protein
MTQQQDLNLIFGSYLTKRWLFLNSIIEFYVCKIGKYELSKLNVNNLQ